MKTTVSSEDSADAIENAKAILEALDQASPNDIAVGVRNYIAKMSHKT